MLVNCGEFQQGHWYRCLHKSRPSIWNDKGKMDFMLDGRPRKYIRAGFKQQFEALPGDKIDPADDWIWYGDFEEVPDPEKASAFSSSTTFTIVDGRPSEPSLLSDIQQDLLRRL